MDTTGLCNRYYKRDEVENIVSVLDLTDANEGQEVEIQAVTDFQLKFLLELEKQDYIEDGDVITETTPPLVILTMNGNFRTFYKFDMEKELLKQEFIDKFGDPIAGLRLDKPIVIWFPTYFTVMRIVFVLTTLILWKHPFELLLVRAFNSFCRFILITIIKPYES